MVYLSLAELGVILLTIYGSWSAMRSQQRAHARREDLLVNELLHSVGKPWQRAPVDRQPQEPIDWEEQMERLTQHYSRFTTSPEQEP